MSTILTSMQERHLRAAFKAAAAKPDGLLGLLTRVTGGFPNRNEVALVGVAEAPYPERGATTTTFSRIGAWKTTIEGQPWKAGLEITEKDLVGDTMGVLGSKGREMAGNFALQYYAHLIEILAEGDTDTYGTAFDGEYFFDTDHVYPGDVEYKTAMRNLLTSSEVSELNVTDSTNPTVAEWQAMAYPLMDYIARNIKTDRGKDLFTGVETAHLIVPMAMGYNARKAFEAELTGGGDTNVTRGMWRVHTVPKLTAKDTNIFYLYLEKPGASEKPFVHGWWKMSNGQRYQFKSTGDTSKAWVAEDRQLISVSSFEDIVYGDWRLIYRCVLS